jgi:predicted Zn-dependent protease
LKEEFFALAGSLGGRLRADEMLTCNFSGERSDFVRFNRSRVRQAGSVEQRYVTLRLVHARRQATATLAVSDTVADLADGAAALERLRGMLGQLPEDPWLLVATEVSSTTTERRGTLMAPQEVVRQVVQSAAGVDLVGFYAGGTLCRGFANSLGQRNWHEVDTFNFEWSLHLEADRAVKDSYAGLDWDAAVFAQRLAASRERLELLKAPARTIEPGPYRAFLAPRAVDEIMGLLNWGGFSAKARATRQSPLLRMEHGERLSPRVSVRENTAASIAPQFQHDGYVKPPQVELICEGVLGEPLTSPRSAMEYGIAPNAANNHEQPEALDMQPGALPEKEVLAALDTGLYIGNLWYLNYSDRPAGRITGMTRFATFWVENGRIAAPVNVMRFDDTVYRILGTSLIDLTATAELMLDSSTYGERSTGSARLPGALLESLRFTL